MTARIVAVVLMATLLPAMAGADGGKVGGYCEMAIERLAQSAPEALRDETPRPVARAAPEGGVPMLLILQQRMGALVPKSVVPESDG